MRSPGQRRTYRVRCERSFLHGKPRRAAHGSTVTRQRVAMARSWNSIMLRLVPLSLAAPLLLAACLAQPVSGEATATTPGAVASPSEPPALPSDSFPASPQCPDHTWPPYRVGPVAGISVRAINKGHTEITNPTNRTYYYRVSRWSAAHLLCGHDLVEHEVERGPIAAGETIDYTGGSTPDAPLTVAIWDGPCGEACHRPPIGLYVVSVSSVEPVPIST